MDWIPLIKDFISYHHGHRTWKSRYFYVYVFVMSGDNKNMMFLVWFEVQKNQPVGKVLDNFKLRPFILIF